MKFKYKLAVIFTLFCIINSVSDGSCYETSTLIDQWNSTMTVENSEELVFSPPRIFEFGNNDQFSFAPKYYKFQNTSQPLMEFSVIGNKSYWEKNDYQDRKNTMILRSIVNESTLFKMITEENTTSFDFLFNRYEHFSTGSICGYNFTSKYGIITITSLGIKLVGGIWYRILYNNTNQQIKILEYANFTLYDVAEISVESKINLSISIDFKRNSTFVIDNAQYFDDNIIYFNCISQHSWTPDLFMGINATTAKLTSYISIPTSEKNYSLIHSDYNSSVMIVSYKNPFNVNDQSYSFYIAKIVDTDQIYLYSENGINWDVVGMGESIKVSIAYSTEKIEYIEVGSKKYIGNSSVTSFLENGEVFGLIHEGYSDQNVKINLKFSTNGYVPDVSYNITYEDQKAIKKYAFIEVYATNALDHKSGVFRTDGLRSYRMYDGHVKVKIYNSYENTQFNYVVLLYKLDGNLFLNQSITINVFYFDNDENPISEWMIKYLFWSPYAVLGFAGIAIVKSKRKNGKVVSSKKKNVKTFYPHIGELPKGCKVKNKKLVCPNKVSKSI